MSYFFCPFSADFGIWREVAFFLDGSQAVCYGRYAFHACFERSTDGAAVVQRYGGIVSVVDAADYKVWLAWQNLFQGNLDAINGASRAGEYAVGNLPYADGAG